MRDNINPLEKSARDFMPEEVSKFAHLDKKAKARQCPACFSYYINEKECEACGFQFDKDLLGKPFSSKSHYDLQDYFWSRPINRLYFRLGFKKNVDFLSYRRHLLHRFEALCLYFFSKDLELTSRWFEIEFEDLVNELVYIGEDRSRLNEYAKDLWLDFSSSRSDVDEKKWWEVMSLIGTLDISSTKSSLRSPKVNPFLEGNENVINYQRLILLLLFLGFTVYFTALLTTEYVNHFL